MQRSSPKQCNLLVDRRGRVPEGAPPRPHLTLPRPDPHLGGMNGQPTRRVDKALLLKLAVVAVAGLAVVVAVLAGFPIRHYLQLVLEWIKGVGPTGFFIGMTILPALGFPLLAFTLSAGPVFSAELGMPLVLLIVTASLLLNMSLTYWLARYAFRPLLEGIIKKLGYGLPEVSAEDHVSLIVMCRVTPGIPFFVQGYLLGLAEVPFRLYLLLSSAIAIPMALSLIIFADSLIGGKGRIAFFAFGVVVALSVGIQWIRRRIARRKAAELAASS